MYFLLVLKMTTIDITGLDKVKLLKCMWDNVPFMGCNKDRGYAFKFDEEEAKEAVKNYIDYFCGKCIKTDLSGDTCESRLYNHDSKMPLEDVIENMR